MEIHQCAECKNYNPSTNKCDCPTFKAKWNEKNICPGYQESLKK